MVASLYESAAKQGLAEAQYRLGKCLFLGKGVEKDTKKAIYYYKLAADKGVAEAQYDLGACYLKGDVIEQNYEKAKYWLIEADKRGYNHHAASLLGDCFYYGYKDVESAKYWYQKAAVEEDRHAIDMLNRISN